MNAKHIDRLPPFAAESEQALIGCCLADPVACIPQIQAVLSSEAFYSLPNRIIWDLVREMDSSAVNLISVQQKLKDGGTLAQVGGLEYLGKCQDACLSTAHIEVWIGEVSAKHTRRKIIATCTEAVKSAYESTDDTVVLLDSIETAILKIRPSQKNTNGISALVDQAVERLEYKFHNPDKMGGLSTGLPNLDRMSDGMHKGEMIVIAGFPSTGKTALAVNLAVSNALSGIPAAIFSAEMRPVQLVVRSLCSNSQANYHKLADDTRALERMAVEAHKMRQAPLYIEAAQGMTIGQVQAISRRLKQKHDIQIVVVDYIQLLSGTGDNREQQISSISKGLKAIALELELPVLGLSQLTDDGKLRESRAIGQDADTIWKLENEGEWKPTIQPINLIVEKCRDGETGKVQLTFLKTITRFTSVAKIDDKDVPNEE
jgi:replicative DNA helicase